MELALESNQIFLYRAQQQINSEYNVSVKQFIGASLNPNMVLCTDQVLPIPREIPEMIPRSEIFFPDIELKVSTSFINTIFASARNETMPAFYARVRPAVLASGFLPSVTLVGALRQREYRITDEEYTQLRGAFFQPLVMQDVSGDARRIEFMIDHFFPTTSLPNNEYVLQMKMALLPGTFLMISDLKIQRPISALSPESYDAILAEFATSVDRVTTNLTQTLHV